MEGSPIVPFIEISCLCDVTDDVIKGEGSVTNCTASCWSVIFTQMNQMTTAYGMAWMASNRLHDLILLSSSFQINFPDQVGNFITKKSILVPKLFIFEWIGYVIYFMKWAVQGGQYGLQN